MAFLESRAGREAGGKERRREGGREGCFLPPVDRSENGCLLIYYVCSKAMQANRYAAVEGLMVVIHPGCGVWADLKALLQSSDFCCCCCFAFC